MDSHFYKSPWFLTLVAIAIWSWGYITADDKRIKRENQAQHLIAKTHQNHHRASDTQCQWQEAANHTTTHQLPPPVQAAHTALAGYP